MKQTLSISNLILDELLAAIESIGIDGTIRTLKEAKFKSLILKDLNIDFVITCVSEMSNVSKERILNGSDRSDDRKMAIALCVFFIKDEFFYSLSDIKGIFNKDISALSRYYTLANNRSEIPKTIFEKKLNTNFNKIKSLLIQKKLNDGKQIQ